MAFWIQVPDGALSLSFGDIVVPVEDGLAKIPRAMYGILEHRPDLVIVDPPKGEDNDEDEFDDNDETERQLPLKAPKAKK